MACTNIIMKSKKGCRQLSSNNTSLFTDIHFSLVKTAEDSNAERVDYCGLVKRTQKRIFLSMLEILMVIFPGGYYLVMKIKMIVPGVRTVLVIVYKYNYRKVPGFIADKGGDSTAPDYLCLFYFPDTYSNFSIIRVVHLHILGIYFNAFNVIDQHNNIWKYELELEKYWFIKRSHLELGLH